MAEHAGSPVTFYTNPMSRGRIIRWMLEEVGAPYQVVVLDYASSMKTPAYLAINPMGKVPAITHRGKPVTECAAICAYLADAFPQARLAPPLDDRASYYRWLFFAAGPVEAAASNHAMGWEPPADRQRMFGYGNYDTTIDALEGAVAGRTTICDHGFTAADVYVGSHLIFGTRFGTIPKRAAFEAYMAGLLARPAYGRAAALDDAATPASAQG